MDRVRGAHWNLCFICENRFPPSQVHQLCCNKQVCDGCTRSRQADIICPKCNSSHNPQRLLNLCSIMRRPQNSFFSNPPNENRDGQLISHNNDDIERALIQQKLFNNNNSNNNQIEIQAIQDDRNNSNDVQVDPNIEISPNHITASAPQGQKRKRYNNEISPKGNQMFISEKKLYKGQTDQSQFNTSASALNQNQQEENQWQTFYSQNPNPFFRFSNNQFQNNNMMGYSIQQQQSLNSSYPLNDQITSKMPNQFGENLDRQQSNIDSNSFFSQQFYGQSYEQQQQFDYYQQQQIFQQYQWSKQQYDEYLRQQQQQFMGFPHNFNNNSIDFFINNNAVDSQFIATRNHLFQSQRNQQTSTFQPSFQQPPQVLFIFPDSQFSPPIPQQIPQPFSNYFTQGPIQENNNRTQQSFPHQQSQTSNIFAKTIHQQNSLQQQQQHQQQQSRSPYQNNRFFSEREHNRQRSTSKNNNIPNTMFSTPQINNKNPHFQSQNNTTQSKLSNNAQQSQQTEESIRSGFQEANVSIRKCQSAATRTNSEQKEQVESEKLSQDSTFQTDQLQSQNSQSYSLNLTQDIDFQSISSRHSSQVPFGWLGQEERKQVQNNQWNIQQITPQDFAKNQVKQEQIFEGIKQTFGMNNNQVQLQIQNQNVQLNNQKQEEAEEQIQIEPISSQQTQLIDEEMQLANQFQNFQI